MRHLIVIGLAMLALVPAARGGTSSAYPDKSSEWTRALRKLIPLRGAALEVECETVEGKGQIDVWISESEVSRLSELFFNRLEQADRHDKLAIARLIAKFSSNFHKGVPYYPDCGTGLGMDLGYSLRSILANYAAGDVDLWLHLLNDADPEVAEVALRHLARTPGQTFQDERVQRRLVIWSGAADVRFRGISAAHNCILPLDERVVVVDRLLSDDHPEIRAEVMHGMDQKSAQALFSRLRGGLLRGDSVRKLAILELGRRANDPSLVNEIKVALLDSNPNVQEEAESILRYLRQ